MATRQEYEQLKAFARIDGALVTLLWTVSFACFVGNFHNAMFGLGFFVFGAASLVVASVRLKRYRDQVLDGFISYRRALIYSLFTYLYASLLFAMVQFLYFQFIDNGFLMTNYMAATESKDFQQMMQVYGVKPEDLRLAMENLASLRPIEIAMQFFSTNIMLGFFVSIPVALITKRIKK